MKSKIVNVKNKTSTSADLYFYGDIVTDSYSKWSNDDTCPKDVIDALKECEGVEQLNIHINSCGGSVFAGIAIYNKLKMFNAKKVVHIDALAASISSVIALVGDEVIMPSNSYLMIHKAWVFTAGNADELRAEADNLDTIEKSIVSTYVENACDGITEDEIKSKMAAETWLTANEAAEMFKNITVAEEVQIAACVTELSFANAPQSIKNALKAKNDGKTDTGEEDVDKDKKTSNNGNDDDDKGKEDEEKKKENEDDDLTDKIINNYLFLEEIGGVNNNE